MKCIYGETIMKKQILSYTVIIFCLIITHVFAAEYNIIQIISNPYSKFSLQINANEYILWQNWDGSDQEIFLYDGTTMTKLAENGYYPQLNNNGEVVWETDTEIFIYDGVSIAQITDNSYFDVEPQINDNSDIAWHGGTEYWNTEIFFYDGTTTVQLTNNSYSDGYSQGGYSQINNNGYVVWPGFKGLDSEIFLYNGTTTIQLTDNSLNDFTPKINDSGEVVWSGEGGDFPDSEIFFYNGTTIIQLTDNSYNDLFPQINANGDVVWHTHDGSDNEIFLYNGTINQLTDNTYDDSYPEISDNGAIVWKGAHDDSDWEIFLYDGMTTTQLTDNSYNDWGCQINASGNIVWTWDGSDSEIFLAIQCITEVCNNIDDDCDGLTDEDLTQDTACGVGACAGTGIEICAAGSWVGDTCTAGVSGTESCNNIDDDCDGLSDEYLTQNTACGTGACASTGVETCNAGSWVGDTCTAGISGTESCNNIDDDCNGLTDEYLTQDTACGIEACASTGIETCNAGSWLGDTCTEGTQTTEICGDSIDQDCNGNDLSCPDDNDDDSNNGDGTGNGGICFIKSIAKR